MTLVFRQPSVARALPDAIRSISLGGPSLSQGSLPDCDGIEPKCIHCVNTAKPEQASLRHKGKRSVETLIHAILRSMRTPTKRDLPRINHLLATSELPTDDLPEQDLTLFTIVETAGELVAVGGLQRCGGVALLRSVATAPPARGHGYARAIVNRLEELGSSAGLVELFLLTETAETFFQSLGYQRLPRAQAPTTIAQSRQFSDLCPDSAAFMSKRLVPAH